MADPPPKADPPPERKPSAKLERKSSSTSPRPPPKETPELERKSSSSSPRPPPKETPENERTSSSSPAPKEKETPALERKSSSSPSPKETPGNAKLERKSSKELPKRDSGQKPLLPVCYLCIREFGSQSIPIHIPQCQRRWLQEQEKLPEHERRPLPKPPYDEEPIKTGGPPQEDNISSEDRAALEASMTQCPHCQRSFVPKALGHHSKFCTEKRPGKQAGTGLTPMSLTNRLVPGEVAGSHHGNASAKPPKLTKMIGLFTNWKLLEKQRSGDNSPNRRDHSVGECSKASEACDACGTCDRPDSNFCSSCGKKRPGGWPSPCSPESPKEDVIIAWIGKSADIPTPKQGRATPVDTARDTQQDKIVVDCSKAPVEIVIQVKPTSPTNKA